MAAAEAALADHVAGAHRHRPDATAAHQLRRLGRRSGPGYLGLLVAQVTRPVRWDLCMATMRALGVTGVLELPPAGTLVGLVKRELKGVATMALKSPDDLDDGGRLRRRARGENA